MSPPVAGRPVGAAAVASFVCLALLAPWLLLCRMMAAAEPESGRAPLGRVLAFCAGAGALAGSGVAFGMAAAARRSGRGALAPALNALVRLWAGPAYFR